MFPASPPSFLATKKFDPVGLNLLRDSVLAYFLNLGALSSAGVQGLSGWFRLLTLTSMIMDMTSSTDLLPSQISLNRHQPAGPVGMSPTLDFFPCFCPWHLQSELRSPASCYLWEVTHPRQPLYPAAFMLSASSKHCFFKAPGKCHQGHLLKSLLVNLLDTLPKPSSASNT